MPRSRGPSAADHERWRKQQERDAERSRKAAAAVQKVAEREARRQYVAGRAADAERRSRQLDGRVQELRMVLTRGLSRSSRLELTRLRRRVTIPPLDLGTIAQPLAPPDWSEFAPTPPSALGRLFGGETRYQHRLDDARGVFERAQAAHQQAETERQGRVVKARRRHAVRLAEAQREVDEHNRTIEELAAGLRARGRDAVERYLGMVLAAVPLPSDSTTSDIWPSTGRRIRRKR